MRVLLLISMSTILGLLLGCEPAPKMSTEHVASVLNDSVSHAFQVLNRAQMTGVRSAELATYEEHWGPYPGGFGLNMRMEPFFNWVPHQADQVLTATWDARGESEDSLEDYLRDVERIEWNIRMNGNVPRFVPVPRN